MTLAAASVDQLAASVTEVCSQTDAAAQSSTGAAAQACTAKATVASLDRSVRDIGTILQAVSAAEDRVGAIAAATQDDSVVATEGGLRFGNSPLDVRRQGDGVQRQSVVRQGDCTHAMRLLSRSWGENAAFVPLAPSRVTRAEARERR